MRMNPKNLIYTLCALCLLYGYASAPLKEKTLAVRFYDKVDGTLKEKCSAYWGFVKWPKHFGHPQQEIFNLIERESGFEVRAKSKRGAYGLMQCRKTAFNSIAPPPDGRKYFKYVTNGTNREKVISEYYAYRPWYNIYAGCAYYRKCKRMAKAQTVGRFKFTQREVAKMYYVTGIGNWLFRIKPTLKYIQQEGG